MEAQLELFEKIRTRLISEENYVSAGKMMSTEAIKYNGKVFAFISRNGNMVFKFGVEFNPDDHEFESVPFNPFKKKSPLAGWFEVSYSQYQFCDTLTKEALSIIKRN